MLFRSPAVTQQKRMVPIPFYVQTNPSKDVQQVVLYYRTIGERIFQQMPLSNNGQAWVGTIGCDVLTVLDPTGLDYYIAALDATNQLLATAGSEAQPFQISVVDIVTTPPPPPPGEAAPEACQEECPPWDPACNENCVQYADVCSDEEPCCKGLVCMDGVCEEGEEEEGGGGDGSDIKHHARIFLNGGTGFGLVGPGTYDHSDFPNMIYTGSIDTKVGIALSKLHVRLGAMFALPVDKLEVGLNGRFDLPLSPDYPPIAVSVIANVSYRIVGENKAKGFQMMAVAGFGWMNIMHRIPFDDCRTVNAADGQCADPAGWYLDANDIIKRNGFRKSGFLGVELGLDMYYWLHKNVGINLGAIFDIAFPVFALNLDVQAGVAFRF